MRNIFSARRPPLPSQASYGVYLEGKNSGVFSLEHEELRLKGYTQIQGSPALNLTLLRELLLTLEGRAGEAGVVRNPYAKSEEFQKVALDGELRRFLDQVFRSEYILLEQNGVYAPSGKDSSQSRWHRDLPYQTFVPSSVFAVNCLLTLDEFNTDNGATWVLPGSHLRVEVPSDEYVVENAVQVRAEPGCFLILDAFLLHAAGHNYTQVERCAINHIFGPPILRSRCDMIGSNASPDFLRLLGKR